MPHCIILNANKAVGCGIFGRFSNLYIRGTEAAGIVISGMFVGPFVILGQMVFEIFEELISCQTNKRTNMMKPIPIARNVLPQNHRDQN